jgi:cation diffusion facilitator family transporter
MKRPPPAAQRDKQTVAVSSLAAAALLTALKAVVGVLTGSLGLLAEAAHSLLDLVAACVTYLSVGAADRPADPDHPFGHGKIENLSAFVETALLVVTSVWITWEAVRRLFVSNVHVEPSVWAFAVLAVSMAVDFARSRALLRAARRYNSQALEADALHFSIDVYSGGVVILGLLLIDVSRAYRLPWLARADAVAALAVAGVSLYVGLRLGNRTVGALLDAAPPGVAERIAAAVSRISEVDQERIRVRQSGGTLFVDLRLRLPSNIPLEHAKVLERSVESEVRRLYPTADLIVDLSPQEPAAADLVERIRAVAHADNFSIHDVTAYRLGRRINVELDLELEPTLPLEAAHDRATGLERAIQRAVPEVGDVNVHIEPLRRTVQAGAAVRRLRGDVEAKLRDIVRATPGVVECHDVHVHRVGGRVAVTVHCLVGAGQSVAEVHDMTERLETQLRQAFPDITDVNIHPEPAPPSGAGPRDARASPARTPRDA